MKVSDLYIMMQDLMNAGRGDMGMSILCVTDTQIEQADQLIFIVDDVASDDAVSEPDAFQLAFESEMPSMFAVVDNCPSTPDVV